MNEPRLPEPLAIAYLSEEWAEEALKVVETDATITAALKGASVSLMTIILEPPEGRYGFIFAAFDEAGLKDYRVGHDYHAVTKDIEAPTFVVSGHYEVFASIQRHEITERKALMTGKLHLTGSWTRALRHMRALETITASLASIECDT